MSRSKAIKPEQSQHRISRRDALKSIGIAAPAAAIVQLTPAVAESGQASNMQMEHPAPATPGNSGPYVPKILNAHEWKTITVLSDIVIPADDRSGSATHAGVVEFIDDWLDFKRGNLLSEIRGGLTWLDIESNRQFSRDFADATSDQQRQLLDRIAYPAKASKLDSNAVEFFNHFRDLVLAGFFSSKTGVADLGYMGNKFAPDWNGCPPAALEKLGVSYDEA